LIGSRPGEKNHELLVSQYEALNAYVYDTNYFVILPMIDTGRDYSQYRKSEKTDFHSFASNNAYQMPEKEFISMLEQDGWLKKDVESDLEELSKEEILQYFRISGFKK
jgi:UDP-N-acetylglucosamine 4,6-dehydratase/5-epimerase